MLEEAHRDVFYNSAEVDSMALQVQEVLPHLALDRIKRDIGILLIFRSKLTFI